MVSYYICVTFCYSIAYRISYTYMLIEKRKVQPKEPEFATLVHKATEP